MRFSRPALCAALLLALPAAGVGAAESAGLFSPEREAAPPRAASRRLRPEAPGGGGFRRGAPAAQGAFRPSGLRSRVAEIDLGRLEAARLGAEGRGAARLRLNLFADAEFEAVFERSAPTASGYALTGRIEGEPLSTVVLAVNGEWVAGTVWSPAGRYAVRPLGGGVAEVRQLDPSALGRCGVGMDAAEGAVDPSLPGIGGPSRSRPLGGTVSARSAPLSGDFPEDDGSVIDLLVVYPPFARRSTGGHLAMRALIDSDVALANEAYRASGAGQRLNLVGAVELRSRPVEQAMRIMPDFLDSLLDGSDGHMDEAHGLRDAYAADMVLAHWGHSTGGRGRGLTIGALGGVAVQMEGLSGDYAPLAFSVANSQAFAHELGHGMGLRHERAQDSGNTPFPYSHGYVVRNLSPELPPEREGVGWQTIMAAVVDFDRDIPFFSNPNLRYPDGSGVALGVPGDAPSDRADGPADAVRSLNGTRRVVANFRRSASRCRYELSAPQRELPASGGEFRIGVRAGSGCAWSAWSNDGFVSVADGAGGVGDGEVVFRVPANGGWERDVAVFVAGEAYLAEQATAKERRTPPPVCGRSPRVRDAITAAVGKEACGEVTASDLASIRVLDLGCALHCAGVNGTVPIGSLDGLTGLVSLGLASNFDKLTELEPGLFDGLTKLTTLSLANNDLKALRTGVFDGVPNLVNLNVSFNYKLATLEPGAFRGLAHMEELYLGEVGLTELRAGAFEGLSNLRSLVVHAPVAKKIELGAFKGLSNLRRLQLLGFGKVAELPSGLFDGLSNLWRLGFGGFGEVWELPELPLGLFDGLANLRTLGLANFGEVSEFPLGLFDGLANLRTLDLADFGEVSELPSGLFDGLANLNHLVLSRFEQVAELPSGVFDGLPLELLRLVNMGLRSLEPGVFDGLSRLRWLDLSDNKLATVHPNLLRGRGLDSLRQVELDGNQLATLHPDLFRGLGTLWYVDLSRNRLRTVPPSLFDEQQRGQMDVVKLGGNRLVDIDPGLLRGMAIMSSLQLSDNRFATLPPSLFNGLYGLLKMDLSGNPGAPFAFRPEFVRLPGGASGSGRDLEVVLEIPQGAAFDLRVGLSATGGSLSTDGAFIGVGRSRSGAVAVAPDGAGPVTVQMVEASDVPGSPCGEISYHVSITPHCFKGVRTALGAPLVLYGLPDQTLAPDGAVRFDLPSAFPDFPDGTAYMVELGDPAVAVAAIDGGLLTVRAAGGGVAEAIVTATPPPGGLSAALTFTVTVEQPVSSYWGGWRSVLLRPPPTEADDES